MFKFYSFFLAFLLYNVVRGENEIKETVKETVKETLEERIDFLLFTKNNPLEGVEFEDELPDVDFNKPIKFIVHGWLESSNRDWYANLTEALLKKSDCVVIQVNWSFLARMEYSVSAKNTKTVGDKIGELIVKLHNEKGVPLANFHIIGHSLGGHVAGFAGKKVVELTGEKIWKITGLDAAGPLFEKPQKPKEERLCEEDAEIVENIHTDAGAFGYKEPIGTLDYYANDGTRIQPGCGPVETVKAFSLEKLAGAPNCSHSKSHQFYIRALNGERFAMTKCESWDSYKDGKCKKNKVIYLGDDNDDFGTFYFQTNDSE